MGSYRQKSHKTLSICIISPSIAPFWV